MSIKYSPDNANFNTLSSVKANVGGTMRVLSSIKANVGGSYYELLENQEWEQEIIKKITWSRDGGTPTTLQGANSWSAGNGYGGTSTTGSCSCSVTATFILTETTVVTIVRTGHISGGVTITSSSVTNTTETETLPAGTYTRSCTASVASTGVSGSSPVFASGTANCSMSLSFSKP